jgi:hypothetical protein
VDVRRALTPHWLATANMAFDRFASRNDAFDAQRFTFGGFLTLVR